MRNRGNLLTLGQRTSDVSGLLSASLSRFGRPSMILSDRWREAELRDALDVAGIPGADLQVRGQGFRDGGEDLRDFRRACLEGHVTPGKSLLMRSAMGEARVVTDPAGNSNCQRRRRAGDGQGRGMTRRRRRSLLLRQARGGRPTPRNGGVMQGWRGEGFLRHTWGARACLAVSAREGE